MISGNSMTAPGSCPHTVSLIGSGPGSDPPYALRTDLDERVIIASITRRRRVSIPLVSDDYVLLVTVQ
jgi:hypothetical protein